MSEEEEREGEADEKSRQETERHIEALKAEYEHLYRKPPIGLTLKQLEDAIREHPITKAKRPFEI